MATSSLERINALAAAYPETEPSSQLATPDVRVRRKIFVTGGHAAPKAVSKLPLMVQSRVLQSHPEAFSADPGWGWHGWTIAQTDKIDATRLGILIDVAWRRVAPKTLAAAHGASAEVIR